MKSFTHKDTHCSHCGSSRSELRRKEIQGGAIQYVMQCQTCGAGSCAIAKKTALGMSGGIEPPDFDRSISREYAHNKSKEYQQEKQVQRAEYFAWYSEYLKSDKWKSKRKKVLLRAQGICEGCRDAEATEVHHLTYDNAGDEFLWELVAVCHDCHERYHDQKNKRLGRS